MNKNFKQVGHIQFGAGCFNNLTHILQAKRKKADSFIVFIVDDNFIEKPLAKKIPKGPNDLLFFEDITTHEPTTKQVDELRNRIIALKGLPEAVVGIGGGSILDIAKAVSLMLTNKGTSEAYQGLNLIKQQGIYHIGIPTLSGTGAECSMTAVLSGTKRKLGLKSDHTLFDQIILDPELIIDVPKEQWFFTAMDTYIHNIESINGHKNNCFSNAYAQQSLALCRSVFKNTHSSHSPENNEKLMVASLFGGLSLSYSEVGACHALSYGLSHVLGMKHGYANCVVFGHLSMFYGNAVNEFQEIVKRQKIDLPKNISAKWSSNTVEQLANTAYNLPHMWQHAIGENWQQKWTLKDIKSLYCSM